MPYPLNVALVWHMHQPYYRNALSGEHRLPWVRLHATKDYLHMAELLDAHPSIHQTFNFVPSLVEQLLEYSTGDATDPWLRVSSQPQLSTEDKLFVLRSFFSINADRFINRIPRYAQLLRIREQVGESVELLSDAYWRDLIVWFNLAWIDPDHIRADPDLAALYHKGSGFTRPDIDLILAKHRAICAAVVPAYRRLRESGQVELTTSPYFHPILPLLIDSASALDASPRMALPAQRFAHPEDAAEQIRRAVDYHTRVFGAPPSGIWPSEGAVSPETVAMIAARGDIRWLATDEAILARSLGITFARDGHGHLQDPRALYQPYAVGADPGVAVVFRDITLSDRIGFHYSQWVPEDAATDLISRLELAADRLAATPDRYLACIILDGENCWEFYQNNGNDFLHALYGRFERSTKLRTVTVSEHLRESPPRARLTRLRSGSWIYGNLETWIGEPEQNRAWEYLALARAKIATWQRDAAPEDVESLERVWRQLYICEGSDWFWWYYSHNRPAQGGEFDAEYRSHLASLYAAMGQQHPTWLDEPIAGPPPEHRRGASGYLEVPPQAVAHTPDGWERSGFIEVAGSTGSMQRASNLVARLRFGYNPRELGLRVEANASLVGCSVALYVSVPSAEHRTPHVRHWETNAAAESHGASFTHEIFVPIGEARATVSRATPSESWLPIGEVDVAETERSVDVRIPLDLLDLRLGDSILVVAAVSRDGTLVEMIPERGTVALALSFS